MELLGAMRGNPAVRAFTDEPVSATAVEALLEVARFAPSGGNRQPWHVAVVEELVSCQAMSAVPARRAV